jgi:hypothetical protein
VKRSGVGSDEQIAAAHQLRQLVEASRRREEGAMRHGSQEIVGDPLLPRPPPDDDAPSRVARDPIRRAGEEIRRIALVRLRLARAGIDEDPGALRSLFFEKGADGLGGAFTYRQRSAVR